MKEEKQEKLQKSTKESNRNKKFQIPLNNNLYISQLLLNFNQSEKNIRLDEMIYDIYHFKEICQKTNEGFIPSPKPGQQMHLLYHYLEKHLIEISDIPNKEERLDRINRLFSWYKDKLDCKEKLKYMTMKTYKDPGVIDELDLLLLEEERKLEEIEDKEMKEEENVTEENPDNAHRNNQFIYKGVLNNYKRKTIFPQFIGSVVSKTPQAHIDGDADRAKEGGQQPQQTLNEENITINNMGKTLSAFSIPDFSSGDFSTFYCTKNGTNAFTLKRGIQEGSDLYKNHIQNINQKDTTYLEKADGGVQEKQFFHTSNKIDNSINFFPPLNREMKYSYSYNRPSYDFNLLQIENKIIDCKRKMVAEKRETEEIKEKLNEFGQQRAKYKENLTNKYEIRNIIKMLVSKNDFHSPMLEKYKKKNACKEKSKEEIKENEGEEGKSLGSLEKKLAIPKRKKESTSEINKNEDSKDSLSSGRKKLNYSSSKAIKVMKRSSSQIQNINPKTIKDFNLHSDKIKINDIKNIDMDTKSLHYLAHENVKKIKMKMKFPKEKNLKRVLGEGQYNPSNVPSDKVYGLLIKDKLFKDKLNYSKICKVNANNKNNDKNCNSLYSESQEESENSYNAFSLSAYDQGNIKKIDECNKVDYREKEMEKLKLFGSRNKINLLQKSFYLCKNNLLNFRRTMSQWKIKDYDNLVNKIKKRKILTGNSKDNNDNYLFGEGERNGRSSSVKERKRNPLEDALVNPSENIGYSQYFLPRCDSMLLNRTGQVVAKKKKKK